MKFEKTTDIRLAGHDFTIYHWSPTRVMKNMPRIGRYFAVPLATVAGAIMAGGKDFGDALPQAVMYLFNQMEEDDVMSLIDLILDGVEVDSIATEGTMDLDVIFDGNTMAMLELITKVLEINYGCFFDQRGFESLRNLLQKMGMVKQIQDLDPDLSVD